MVVALGHGTSPRYLPALYQETGDRKQETWFPATPLHPNPNLNLNPHLNPLRVCDGGIRIRIKMKWAEGELLRLKFAALRLELHPAELPATGSYAGPSP